MSQSPFRSRASAHRSNVFRRYARTASTVALVCSLLFAAAKFAGQSLCVLGGQVDGLQQCCYPCIRLGAAKTEQRDQWTA